MSDYGDDSSRAVLCFMHFGFVFTVSILLINLLIALMTDKLATMAQHRYGLFLIMYFNDSYFKTFNNLISFFRQEIIMIQRLNISVDAESLLMRFPKIRSWLLHRYFHCKGDDIHILCTKPSYATGEKTVTKDTLPNVDDGTVIEELRD